MNWNASMMFPADSNFILRVTEASFGPSKGSGNPMITYKAEVVSPEEVEIGGQKVNIAGTSMTNYRVTKVLDKDGNVDAEGTENCFKATFVSGDPEKPSLYEALGIDGATIDPENPDVKVLVGKCFYAQVSPDVEEQRKNPTPDQIEKAKKAGVRAQGDVMKHPVTGKALIKYWPKIREIFGPAPSGSAANKPF